MLATWLREQSTDVGMAAIRQMGSVQPERQFAAVLTTSLNHSRCCAIRMAARPASMSCFSVRPPGPGGARAPSLCPRGTYATTASCMHYDEKKAAYSGTQLSQRRILPQPESLGWRRQAAGTAGRQRCCQAHLSSSSGAIRPASVLWRLHACCAAFDSRERPLLVPQLFLARWRRSLLLPAGNAMCVTVRLHRKGPFYDRVHEFVGERWRHMSAAAVQTTYSMAHH